MMGRKSIGTRAKRGFSPAGGERINCVSERYSLEQPAPVIVHGFERFQSGRLINFSESGLCVQGVSGLSEGDCVRLQFVLRETAVIMGVVQWAMADRVGIALSERLPAGLKRHLNERIGPLRVAADRGAPETRDAALVFLALPVMWVIWQTA